MERGARSGQGHLVVGQERRGISRAERFSDQQRASGEQGADQPSDAADVGEGEHQGGYIIGPDVEALGHSQGRGHHREVGVGCALGVGSGARRVEEPRDRSVSRRRRGQDRGQHGRVTVGQCAVYDQDRQSGPVGGDLVAHGLEVEPAVDGRDDE